MQQESANETLNTGMEIIEPDLPIVDCHHHLWVLESGPYLIDDFARDIATGHNIVATVFVECDAMYRQDGPRHLRTVGEAEFVAGQAAMSASGLYGQARICAGFVAAADLTLGAAVDEVLSALTEASGGRLRGIRGKANWDADPSVNTGVRAFSPPHMLLDENYRAGVARMQKHGLVYDAWQYHPQLNELCDLAGAFPDLPIVVNHCGGLLGIGNYAGPDNFKSWRALILETAKYPNVLMKLGGLSAKRCGFGFDNLPQRPTAEQLADAWRPYIETCIEAFGPQRCMFEANFPPDKVAADYARLWNAFKIIAKDCSQDEKTQLFSGTATRVYGLE